MNAAELGSRRAKPASAHPAQARDPASVDRAFARMTHGAREVRPRPVSLALHERVGFRVIGVRQRIGKRDGLWRDTVLLERRSEVVE